MTGARLYTWGEFRFEPAEYRLMRDGEQVALPGKTLDLLALLVSRAPSLVAKAEMLSSVWPDAEVEEGNIAFHVAMLRKTLDRDNEPTCIETVRGRGYRFVAPLVVTPLITPPSTANLDLPPAVASIEVARPRSWFRRGALLATAAVVAAIIGRSVVRTAEPTAVLVAPFEVAGSADSANLGVSLAQFVVASLSESGVDAVTPDGGPEGETPRGAATRLGAAVVLTGVLTMTTEQRWRVSLHLVRAQDGRTVWNWTFEAPFNEHRHQLQEQIATLVSTGLRLRLAEELR